MERNVDEAGGVTWLSVMERRAPLVSPRSGRLKADGGEEAAEMRAAAEENQQVTCATLQRLISGAFLQENKLRAVSNHLRLPLGGETPIVKQKMSSDGFKRPRLCSLSSFSATHFSPPLAGITHFFLSLFFSALWSFGLEGDGADRSGKKNQKTLPPLFERTETSL